MPNHCPKPGLQVPNEYGQLSLCHCNGKFLRERRLRRKRKFRLDVRGVNLTEIPSMPLHMQAEDRHVHVRGVFSAQSSALSLYVCLV